MTPEDDGHRNRQVLLAWNEEPRKCAGNESDDDGRDNESKHGVRLSGSRAERRSEIGPVERLPDADTVHHPYGGSEHTPREVILGDDFARERSDHRGDRRRLRRGGEGLGQHVRSVQRPRGCSPRSTRTRLSSTPSTNEVCMKPGLNPSRV